MAVTLGAKGYIDTATYWPAPTETGYGGIEFGPPQVIMTKWEDTVIKFIDAKGSDTQSQSIVYVMIDVEEGGYLMKGDHSSLVDPSLTQNAYYIRRVDKVRDLRGLHEEIKAYL